MEPELKEVEGLSQFKPVTRDRVGVVETVYYQDPKEEHPTSVVTRYTRWVDSPEQPYGPRKITLTESWAELDCMWVEAPSILLLSNEEGKRYVVRPTEEELKTISKRVVEIAQLAKLPYQSNDVIVVPFAQVRPGESIRFQPLDLFKLRVRCVQGTAVCKLTAFPS